MRNRRHFMTLMAASAAATGAGLLPAQAWAQAAGAVESAWSRVQRTQTLRIGAVNGAAPYYHKALGSQEWQGFMIDFAQSFAASLGVKLAITETTWGNSVLDLQSNKIDVFFGINPTPARAEVIDFSDPLFSNAFVFVARKGLEVKTWADVNKPEIKIAVDLGSSHDQAVTKLAPKATITRLEKAADATLAVQSGRADLQVLVPVLALTVVSKNPSIGRVIVPTPIEATTTTVGLRKEADPQMRAAVNKWIAAERAANRVRPVVLGNLEKLSGVKPEQVPSELPF
ncbi:MAG: transporter substrate-binding domain-containing protein [Comamonas sp.]